MSISISLGGVASTATPAFSWHAPQKSKSQPEAQRYRSSPGPFPAEQPSQPHWPPLSASFSRGCSCLPGGRAGRFIMARSLGATPPLTVDTRKANSGSSSPAALAFSLKLLASGVIAASAAAQAAGSPSQNAMMVGSSLTTSTFSETVPTAFGYQGNSAPVGSLLTAPRPSLVMTDPSLSRMTKLGMPSTPKCLLSSSFSFLCE
mmetsp:Transcript_15343/g.40745  ORF Transcript_15343/g.40745 Transcript_15343/m.40745 type:complete len:204 (+) Transcript_15343:155-766(+)